MAEVVRGYIHDPKEPDGPYIAVVLAAGLAPVISVHNSYKEAEKELSSKLAAVSENTLSSSGKHDPNWKPDRA